jgi:hypothetical protein
MKAICATLILTSYLLIGLLNSINSVYQKPISRVYVHSLSCQLKNYLRLDCFDACNGEQTHINEATKEGLDQNTMNTLSLDFHFVYHPLKFNSLLNGCEPHIFFLSSPLSFGTVNQVFSPPDFI